VEIHVLQGEREMASGNKTLGKFQLTGIPPAPRGIPQIEVTFDIDANGIVHVSAKDLGTGNEQKVVITASTNMSKDDVDKAVKDAEKFANEDKKFKDLVEARNHAEQMIFASEKAIRDLGDKVSADDKSKVEAEIENVKKVKDGEDAEAIRAAAEKLAQASYKISEELYKHAAEQQQQAGGQPGQDYNAGAQGGDGNDGNTVNADYEVKEDK
jgi:molecular chaperone DnaK